MKKLHTYLMIALSLIVGFGITANAEISSNQLIVYLNSDDYDIPEESPNCISVGGYLLFPQIA